MATPSGAAGAAAAAAMPRTMAQKPAQQQRPTDYAKLVRTMPWVAWTVAG